MKIAFLVPDGIGLRNYLYSDVLTYLKGNEITIIHKFPEGIVDEIKQAHPDVHLNFVSFSNITETRFCDIFRRSLYQGRMNLNFKVAKNPTLSKNWHELYRSTDIKKRLLYKFINFVGKKLSKNIETFTRAEKFLFSKMNKSDAGKSCETLLKDINPEVILCTHQRSVEAGYFMSKANELNIKTICVIFSWDNLPKSRNTFWADKYFVWSQLMKHDLQRFYPNIPEDKIDITGTPQFEFYSKSALNLSKEDFCNQYGLPASRPLFCYSGNEPSVNNDHLYLNDLLEALENDKTGLNSKPYIIVRPSPLDNTGRLDLVANKYPHLAKVIMPVWPHFGAMEWENFFPVSEDLKLLNNITKHSCGVINLGSTMGLDFSQDNKPALYINYAHPEQSGFDINACYNQEHFKTSMGNLDAVCFINSPSAFVPNIYKAINNPDSIATERLKWKRNVTDDIKSASLNIAGKILDFQ
ncbi:glycosyltransferase family protein [Polluticaenibacter yanchengensis]|uniref:UDP-glycosyltransferase n=1 Tax=Polluticaenibacter yanchengensis TaxID=3014562 RepID=A0ABT4ULP8_9BACT|nr:hypothetical protein [Chitinophagaceae bacterium LY-5]